MANVKCRVLRGICVHVAPIKQEATLRETNFR